MYYAVNSANAVVATGDSILECSRAAAIATGYAGAPGSVAPYYITNHDWFGETCPMCSVEDENISK